jgi:hypothetical protein
MRNKEPARIIQSRYMSLMRLPGGGLRRDRCRRPSPVPNMEPAKPSLAASQAQGRDRDRFLAGPELIGAIALGPERAASHMRGSETR